MQNQECLEHHFQMTEYIVAYISLLQQGTGKSNRSLLLKYERQPVAIMDVKQLKLYASFILISHDETNLQL